MFREVDIPYLCGYMLKVRYEITDPKRTTIIFNLGFGTTELDKPFYRALTEALEHAQINWVEFLYMERNAQNLLDDLLISSAVGQLHFVHEAVRKLTRGKIGIWGSSFGGNVSLEYGLLYKTDFIILLNPVIDYGKYRRTLSGNEKMRLWEEKRTLDFTYADKTFESSYRFLQEARHQNLEERIGGLSIRTLIFQGRRDNLYESNRFIFADAGKFQFIELNREGHELIEDSDIKFMLESILKFVEE